jgi:type II secretory pathway pseudopilin PulG
MQIANTVASKAIVAAVAAAMIFSAFAAPVKAQSVEEMQKMINDLMTQISALQGQGGTSTSVASGVCPFTWTRDLKTGASGDDVMKLQQFLNSNADTRVAASGAGSVGAETMFFGPATAAAVSKFQVMHRADILTPAGLTNPTGFFGPSTRAKVNALCVAGGATDEDDEDEDGEDTGSGELSGEGTLDTFEMDDAAEDEIEEGSADEVIAEITLEATDGDIEVDRMTFEINDGSVANTEDEPWEVFESITLWVDGDEIASFDASDEENYLDEDTGEFRFSGLGLVLEEDEEVEVLVGASIVNDIDNAGSSTAADWVIEGTEVRYFDADGVAEDDNTSSGSATFTIVPEGDGDELDVKTASGDPDATTLQLEDDAKSDFLTIFAFDLDAKDSDSDIEVTSVRVDVDATENGSTATTTSLVIDDAELVVDGVTYDDVTVTHGTTGQFVFDIDSGDLMIDADDRVTAEFNVRFKSLPTTLEGATVQATVAGANIDAEGGDDVVVGGSATGDEHTLRTQGAILEYVSGSATKDLNTDTTATDDEGVFTLKFDVTAFEGDLYVNKTAASGTTMGTAGVNFQITDGSGAVVGTTTPEASLSSTAETEGTRFKVAEGETETFTLTINYDPGVSGFYGVRLYSLNFATTNANPSTQQRALPEEDYETDPFNI